MRRLSALRFLSIWPLVKHIRARSRRSLAWRLAVSHLVTVLVTLSAVIVVLWLVAAALTIVLNPAGQEPATDARAVARVLAGTIERSPPFSRRWPAVS